MSRIIVNDWLAWGNLLKTWATGRPNPAGKFYPRPKTLEELKAQLVESGAGSIPDWVVDFELVEWNEEKLRIQLPSSETIANAEALLSAGKPYPLPSFYSRAFGEGTGLDELAMRLAFHTMRIGERAINDFG
jgi:hypothetical protein